MRDDPAAFFYNLCALRRDEASSCPYAMEDLTFILLLAVVAIMATTGLAFINADKPKPIAGVILLAPMVVSFVWSQGLGGVLGMIGFAFFLGMIATVLEGR